MPSPSNKIVLKSSDGNFFEIEESVAQQSVILKLMIEDGCTKPSIPIPNVTGDILALVIHYCRKHANTAGVNRALRLVDRKFADLDPVTLVHLMKAARFLGIDSLRSLSGHALSFTSSESEVKLGQRFVKYSKVKTPEVRMMKMTAVVKVNRHLHDETRSFD